MISGKIHSIETCGTVDGPGVRYVLFLQGCGLKCIYCHNPDTWDGGCKKARTMTVAEVVEDIEKYKSFFGAEGGVTVSGGEPLVQAKFVLELFRVLKQKGFHTCLDTSGSVPLNETVKEILSLTDLVLMDIKSAIPDTFKRMTGQSVDNTFAFAKYLSDKKIPMWVRYVVVPGYTDLDKEVVALGEFLQGLRNVKEVDILPFHQMGAHKWEALKMPYVLKDVKTPTADVIGKIKTMLGIKS